MNDNKKIVLIRREVKKIFENASGSHDWEHTKRVYNNCLLINKKENANIVVLKLSALLHDIGREEQEKSRGKLCHAEIGAKLALIILKKHGFDDNIIKEIIHCIRTHRFWKKNLPKSLEAKILYDADKLDAIGAIGIARAMHFAGEHGAKIHNHKHKNIYETNPLSKDDTAYREFKIKLCKVKEKMLTIEGKKIAEHRHKFMEAFFEELNKEAEGKI
ncbi:MAG: HD domain-containing protein [Candidatus ainarchaeum sp.]|nr:HD domain-containing protein [Candidatus ainarchaeum sp.]